MDQAVDLARKSDSILIIAIVVVALILIALIPVMKTLASISKEKRQHEGEREQRLIQVIEKNTEVNSALKALIETDQKFCVECRQEQRALFREMFDNQETTNIKLAEIHTVVVGNLERK